MFNFFDFNHKNRFAAGMQMYNSIAFVYAAYDFYTNPDASWDEQGLEMALNALNLFSLRPDTSMLEGLASGAINLVGAGSFLRGAVSSCSSFSSPMNVISATGHVVSALATAVAGAGGDVDVSRSMHKK